MKPQCFPRFQVSVRSFLLVITFLLITPFQTLADEEYRFERMWPTLQQPWYFNQPQSIVIDASGNIYIADTFNDRIQKFSADGQFITKWGDSEFDMPAGIALDGDGNVYVADIWNHRIQKFTSDGQFITKWGSQGSGDGQFGDWVEGLSHGIEDFWELGHCGLAVDASGNLYVADTFNDRIQKFSPDGQFIAKWGVSGSDDGEFDRPQGIAIDGSGNIYISDSGNSRIQKFAPEGQFIEKWGSGGSGDGEFNRPKGIAIDGNGNVCVADSLNHRIQKFTSDGQFIDKYEDDGSWDGEFVFPSDLVVGSSQNMFVADRDNIRKLTPHGDLVARWGSTGQGNGEFGIPRGIAVDTNGDLYVVDSANNRIQKFTSDGQFITKWGSGGSGDGEFWPAKIAVDASDNIYVTDTGNHRIQKFSSDGQFLTSWGSLGSSDGQFNIPDGIALDAEGNVYVVDTKNFRIQKFTSDGQFLIKWGSFGQGDGEFDFVAEHFRGNPGNGNIAVDVSGNVYVVDTWNHRIQKFTSDGGFVTKWGGVGPGDGEFDDPSGIASDSDGNVYVADRDCRIQKFTSDGGFLSKFGECGSDPGQMYGGPDLGISRDDKIYVVEPGNHRLQVFIPRDSNGGASAAISKAIIVAGGGPFAGNSIWDATQMCANFAYRTLTYQGYTKDTIYYLTSDTDLDLDGNGIFDDVDGDATNSNFQSAITSWAQDAENLFVFVTDHGGNGTFRMGATELLQATQLDTWLDSIQESIPGTVTLVYDACRSGSFLPLLLPPSGKTRVLATSTASDEEALFQCQGANSFSFSFWGFMFNGESFYDSFVNAKSAISVTYNQTPQIEGNGNGVGNERADQEAARALTIGNETATGGDIPVIGSVSPAQTLDGEASALIYAADVIDADGISRVWAIITPPNYSPGSLDTPVTDLPMLDLSSAGNNRYEGTYTNFTETGTYNVAIYALDAHGIISLPMQTTVSQGGEPAPLNVSGISTDLTGPPAAETLVEIAFTTQGETGGTLYYRYYQASGYQTQNYGNWQELRNWSTDNSLTWFSFRDDHYIIVLHVTDDTTSENYHQAGLTIETSGNSANPIQIIDFTTDIDYPQSSGTAISFDTTATGGSGPLNYRYYYRKGVRGQWIEIQVYSTDNSCTWTPTEDGLYVVVVHVTDDISGSVFSTAGMTCTIGE